VDGSGNVFVVDHGNGAVKEIPAGGGYTTVQTPGSGFSEANGTAVDRSGNIFLAMENIRLVNELETSAVDFGTTAIASATTGAPRGRWSFLSGANHSCVS
jgi:sugar lactone lactonase YvrE